MSGRLSGAQQIVLVGQLRGSEERSNILRYVLGSGEVCSDTAGVVYGLDLWYFLWDRFELDSKHYYLRASMLDYYLPAVWVASLLLFVQFFFNRLVIVTGWHGFSGFDLVPVCAFLVSGQIISLYYLQILVACIFIGRFTPFRKKRILG